jgi:hypothetical protein
MTNHCRWWADAVWPLVRLETTYVVALGTLLAGLAAFAGRGVGLLWRRAGRTAQPAAVRPSRRGARGAVVALATASVALMALIAVQLAEVPSEHAPNAELMLDQTTPPPSPSIALLEDQAWAAVGGLDVLDELYTAERDYYSAFDAGANATTDAQFDAAMGKLGTTCDGLDRATRRAEAYFPVPDPAGRPPWSRVLDSYRRLTTACRALVAQPGAATGRAADSADVDAVNSAEAMLTWLGARGAISHRSP